MYKQEKKLRFMFLRELIYIIFFWTYTILYYAWQFLVVAFFMSMGFRILGMA